MTELFIHTEIDRLLGSLDGDLTSHSRVIDAILDVRSASDDVQIIAMADHALRNVPGKNAATTEWLRRQLTQIGLMAEVSLVVTAASTIA